MKNYRYKIIGKNEIKNAIVESYEEIVKNKQRDNLTDDFIKGPLIFLFRFLGGICIFFSILFVITLGIMFKENKIISVSEVVIAIAIVIIFFILLIIFGIYFLKMANEIKKEKDAQYLLAYFSAMVSLVALILSVTDLFK